MPTKPCWICKQVKPHADFDPNPTAADKLDHRCKPCKKAYVKALRDVKKNAPPKPADNRCQVSGELVTNPKDWTPDHDHDTGEFRGWIKKNWNKAMGVLGDDVDGMVKAAVYLAGGDKDAVRKALDDL